MSAAVTEFLNELDEKKALEALNNCNSQKSALFFKTEAAPQMVRAVIESISDKRVILKTDPSDVLIQENVDISMKFNVGTEIFFIKAPIKKYLNQYYFDLSAKVIEFKRRREPRYLIPKKWPQAASIVNFRSSRELIPSHVQDISLSGIRFEVLNPAISFNVEDVIKIRFQIYKRSDVFCEAVVRFALKKPQYGSIIGMEFLTLTTVQKEKIASIVDDIMSYISFNKL